MPRFWISAWVLSSIRLALIEPSEAEFVFVCSRCKFAEMSMVIKLLHSILCRTQLNGGSRHDNTHSLT